MESKTLERWSKELARRSSRRDMTKAAGMGGLGLILVGLMRGQPGAAQGDLPTECAFEIEAAVATGDNAGAVARGRVSFDLQNDWRFENGRYEPELGKPLDLIGTVRGNAIDLRIERPDARPMILHGVGAFPLSTCVGDVAGSFGDLETGELGYWRGFDLVKGDGNATT